MANLTNEQIQFIRNLRKEVAGQTPLKAISHLQQTLQTQVIKANCIGVEELVKEGAQWAYAFPMESYILMFHAIRMGKYQGFCMTTLVIVFHSDGTLEIFP